MAGILAAFLTNTCSDKMAMNMTHDIIGKLMRIGVLGATSQSDFHSSLPLCIRFHFSLFLSMFFSSPLEQFADDFRRVLGEEKLKSHNDFGLIGKEEKATVYLDHLMAYCDVCVIADDLCLPSASSCDEKPVQTMLDRYCEEIYLIK